MSKRFVAGAILVLSCLMSACAPEEDGILSPAGVSPGTVPSQDVGGAIKTDSPPAPEPTPTPAPFMVLPVAYSLSVPSSGGDAPLFETAKAFATDPAHASVQWRSSDTQVAQVDAQGRVTALRAGTAIITASREGREATASVTVEARGRLVLAPTGLPAGAAILARLHGADNTLLGTSEDGKFERASAGSLWAEIEARLAGRLVAVGRVEGMTLHANQVTTHAVPLNVPSLSTAEVSGGPGASVVLRGEKLGGWVKRSYGSLAPWEPVLSATVDGRPAVATMAGDGSSVRLTAPASFDGGSPYRAVWLTIEGIPLDATYRLLDTLRIDTPARTVAVMDRARFMASATDVAGKTVASPGVTWLVRPEDREGGIEGEPVGGIDDTGEFMAWRAGKGVIVARSGNLEATASVTVTE